MNRAMICLGALLGVSTLGYAQFDDAAYDPAMTFTDGGTNVTMGLAFDGTNFWSVTGNGGGWPIHQYDADGNYQATYNPGPDFRSVFTVGSDVYARSFADPTIYFQNTPGSMVPLVTLSGGSLDAQAAVVYTRAEYIANNYGTVDRWDDNGNYIGSFTLSGFGSQNGEADYPQGRGIAYGDGYYLTYANGVISAWDDSGNRLDTAILNDAGKNFDSHFSLSYADGKFWVVDAAGGTWRGYQVLPRGNPCYADLNEDGVLDLFDFLEFTNLFNAGDDLADCNEDGTFDLFDFLCFTNEFNAGC